MDKVELRARLDFWQSALSKLRAAYLALVDGGVKSYLSLAKSDHKRGGITFEAAKANNFRTDTDNDGSIDSPAI